MSEEREVEDVDSPSGRSSDLRQQPSMSPAGGAIVETHRLLLRAPTIEDARTIAHLADNPRVARNLSSLPHPYRVEHALGWIGTPVAEGAQRYLICLKGFNGAPEPVGVVTLDALRDRVPPRLGCWLGEDHWGHGYATEACQAIVDYAFLHQSCDKLGFTCRVTNPAGRRMIEKCGFQMVAQELDRSLYQGAVVPVDRFQLDRRLWQSLRGWQPLRLHRQLTTRGDGRTAAATR